MPRDGSGTYTLPAGNPVVSGTIIDVTWANPTMDDIATALTDSLSRTGSGGMLVPFLNADGAVGSPGISWVNETTSGIYRAGLNDQRWASSGVDKVQVTSDPSNPLLVWNVGDASFRAVTDVFSPTTIIGDWTFEGVLVTDDSTLTRAGFNIPVGVEPSAPNQGDMWVEANNIYAWINGVAESLIGSTLVAAGTVTDNTLRWDGSGWSESTALTLETGPARARFAATCHFDSNAQFHTGVSDYVFFSGFSNIYSFAAFGIVDQLSISGFDVLELDGGNLKMFQIAAPVALELGYGQIWLQNTTDQLLLFRDEADVDWALGAANGTFTGSITGCTAGVNGDIDWVRIRVPNGDDIVILSRDGDLVGTSNTTQMTLTGVPAELRPSGNDMSAPCFVRNEAKFTNALAQIDSSGVITFYAPDNTSNTTNPFWSFTTFGNTGSKGLESGWSFMYRLN